MELYLGLGSNMGDRKAMLDKAVARLSERFGTPPMAVSGYIETAAWGFEGPDFLNAVVVFDLDEADTAATGPQALDEGGAATGTQALDAADKTALGLRILDICKETERELGRADEPRRDADGRRIYADRPIDIDILEIGSIEIYDEKLTVPHPLAAVRDFVRIPLQQVKEQIINQ